MATRISFSTHWPERMGDLAGKRNYFPEKIISGIMAKDIGAEEIMSVFYAQRNLEDNGYKPIGGGSFMLTPKTTTIRKNYNYWKSKEGKMIQPYFWAGKVRYSKQVVFCPEVRLRKVRRIIIKPELKYISALYDVTIDDLSISEGFDSAEHFFRWFNEYFEGALLTWGDQEY